MVKPALNNAGVAPVANVKQTTDPLDLERGSMLTVISSLGFAPNPNAVHEWPDDAEKDVDKVTTYLPVEGFATLAIPICAAIAPFADAMTHALIAVSL